MKRMAAVLLFLIVGLAAPLMAHATQIVTPDSVDPGTLLPIIPGPYVFPFDAVPASQIITDQFDVFGLLFNSVAGVFDDGVPAWGGLTLSGGDAFANGVEPISGSFVVPGTSTSAVTTTVTVHIGLAALNTLTLEVRDINGVLLLPIATNSVNGGGLGGRDIITLSAPGIHSFTIDRNNTTETFALVQIEFADPTPVAVPFPPTLVVVALSALAAVPRLRRLTAARKPERPE